MAYLESTFYMGWETTMPDRSNRKKSPWQFENFQVMILNENLTKVGGNNDVYLYLLISHC